MGRSAAAKTTNIHQYVGNKIRELRGTMPVGDFAARCGMHQALITKLEDGQPSCLARLELLANKHGVEVSSFFPGGTIPTDYPDH